MIRALIFDFNGVLADDDPIHMEAFRQVAREEGLSFTDEEYLDKYLPLNDWDCFKTLFQEHEPPLSAEKLDQLIRRKGVHYFQAIAEKNVLFGGRGERRKSRGPDGVRWRLHPAHAAMKSAHPQTRPVWKNVFQRSSLRRMCNSASRIPNHFC